MKKLVIIISLIFLAWPISSQAQWRHDKINLSVFAGNYLAKQNKNNKGYWYGLYVEYLPVRRPSQINFGLALLASHADFKSNDQLNRYEGKSSQFGLGLSGGKYWEVFSVKNSAYLGSNLMLKKSFDQGFGQSIPGDYHMTQEDLIVSGEINFNIMKNYHHSKNLFPRTQVKFTWQKPISSKKIDFWNGEPISESMIWNKAAIASKIKQSLFNVDKIDYQLQTKALFGHQFYRGDDSHWLVFGPELSLKKSNRDDYLSFYLFVKQRVGDFKPGLNNTQFVFGVNFMPMNIN